MAGAVNGTFTPPDDLQPAIDQLSEKGKSYLEDLVLMNDGKLEHHMIAKAADYERGESQI